MDEVQVGATTFRFPALPSEQDAPAQFRLMTERRESVLAKARKVRGGEPPQYNTDRVSLATCKIEEPAGSVIEVDGERAEVWAPGPAARSVWALLDDGRVVLAQRSRHHTGGWYVSQIAGPDPRIAVTLGLIEREQANSLTLRDITNPRVAPEVRHQRAAQLAWWAWHHLYPGQPFPFDALIWTPNATWWAA